MHAERAENGHSIDDDDQPSDVSSRTGERVAHILSHVNTTDDSGHTNHQSHSMSRQHQLDHVEHNEMVTVMEQLSSGDAESGIQQLPPPSALASPSHHSQEIQQSRSQATSQDDQQTQGHRGSEQHDQDQIMQHDHQQQHQQTNSTTTGNATNMPSAINKHGKFAQGVNALFKVRVKHRKSQVWQNLEFTTSVADLQGQLFESVDAYTQFVDVLVRSRYPRLLRMYHKEDKRAPAWDHILKLEVPQTNKSASLCTHVCSLCIGAQRPWQDCLVAVYYTDGRAKSANANSHMINNHKDEWNALRHKRAQVVVQEASQTASNNSHESMSITSLSSMPGLHATAVSLSSVDSSSISMPAEEEARVRGILGASQPRHAKSVTLKPSTGVEEANRNDSSSGLQPVINQSSSSTSSFVMQPRKRQKTTHQLVSNSSSLGENSDMSQTQDSSLHHVPAQSLHKLSGSALGQGLRHRTLQFLMSAGLPHLASQSNVLQTMLEAAARLRIDFTSQVLQFGDHDYYSEFARQLAILKESLHAQRQSFRPEDHFAEVGSFGVQYETLPGGIPVAVLSWVDPRCWELIHMTVAVGRYMPIMRRRIETLGLDLNYLHVDRRQSIPEGHQLEQFVYKLLIADDVSGNSREHLEGIDDPENNLRESDADLCVAHNLIRQARMLLREIRSGYSPLWAAIASQLSDPSSSPLLSVNENSPWRLLQALILERHAIQSSLLSQQQAMVQNENWSLDSWWQQIVHLEAVLNAALSVQFPVHVTPTSGLAILSLLRARFLLSQYRLGIIDGYDTQRLNTVQDPRGLPFSRQNVYTDPLEGFTEYYMPPDDARHMAHLDAVAQALRKTLALEIDRMVDSGLTRDQRIAMICDPVFVSLGMPYMRLHKGFQLQLDRATDYFELAFGETYDQVNVVRDTVVESTKVFDMVDWRPLTDNTTSDILVSHAINTDLFEVPYQYNFENDELQRWFSLSVKWGTMHPTGMSLRDPFLASTQNAAFEFWKRHSSAFPVVRILASRFLGIPPPFDMSPSQLSKLSSVRTEYSRVQEVRALGQLNNQAISTLEHSAANSDSSLFTAVHCQPTTWETTDELKSDMQRFAQDFLEDTSPPPLQSSSSSSPSAMPIV